MWLVNSVMQRSGEFENNRHKRYVTEYKTEEDEVDGTLVISTYKGCRTSRLCFG